MALSAKFIADFTSFQDAVAKAQVSLRSFETGASQVEKSLNKMSNSFSGTKVIQDANLMAAAMVHAGGITALTDKELRRLNATVSEASEKMRRMGVEVPPGFQKIEEAAARLDKSTAGLSTRMIAVGTAIGTFVGQMAYDAVRKLGKEMLDLASNGIKLAPVVSSFERLTASVGQSGDEMIRVTRTATKGLVTDLDIMAASNKALLLGLPVTSQSLGLMGTAAVALGKAMKQDAAKSLDDLITALGRSSPMILDNLGLTVRVEEANKKYAQQVGKSADALSDAEKKLAFYNAAMDAAKVKVEQLGGVHLTLVDQITRVKNQFTNFTDALGVAIARSPVLEAAFGTLADEMETAFGGNQVARVQELIKWVNEIAIAAVGVAGAFVEVGRFGTQTWTFLQDGVLGLLEAQFRVRAGLRDLIPTQQYKEEAAILRAMADSLRDQAKAGNDQQARLEKMFDAAAAAIARMQSQMIAAKNTQAETASIAADLTQKLQTQSGVSEEVAKATESIRKALIPLTAAQQAQVREWDRSGISADTMAKALNVSTTAVSEHLEMVKKAEEPFKKMREAAHAFHQTSLAGIPTLQTYKSELNGVLMFGEDYSRQLIDAQIKTDAFGNAIKNDVLPSLRGLGGALAQAELRSAATTTKVEKLQKVLSPIEEVLGGIQSKWAQMAVVASRAIQAVSEKLAAGDWVGAIVAAGAALGQFIVKLFKSEESAKVSPLRDVFFKAAGGLEVLNPKVEQLTGSLTLVENIFKARTVDQYNKAIKELNELFEFQTMALETVTATAQKYNLTLEEMGPAWQRQELDKKAQELFKDYQVLLSAGANVTAVHEKMSASVNKYLNDAIAMGVEVPEAMRPMLDAMAQQGVLTDAAGNKITNLEDAGVSFALSMSEGFKSLIAEVQKLTDMIARSLGVALEDVGQVGGRAAGIIRREFDEANDVLAQTEYHVQGIAEGHSPGGFKNVASAASRAAAAVKQFGSDANRVLKDTDKFVKDLAKGITSLKMPSWARNTAQRDAYRDLSREVELLKAPNDFERDKLQLKFDKQDEIAALKAQAKELGVALAPLLALVNEKYALKLAELIRDQSNQATTATASASNAALSFMGGVSSGNSFAQGTGGKYLDFKGGTLAMLHGRERVMTEAEGRAEGRPIEVTVISKLDELAVGRAMVRVFPGAVKKIA